MPDLPECILPPEKDLEASQVQRSLRAAARELEAIERRLTALGAQLPPPAEPFELLGELRAAIDCVRGDLLADAIATLQAAGSRSESRLRRECLCRRQWLVM